MRDSVWCTIVTSAAVLALAGCSAQDPVSSTEDVAVTPAEKTISGSVAGACESCAPWPRMIQFPADFGPEGIAAGLNNTFYAGSVAASTFGQIYKGDLKTGRLKQLVATTGRPAIGMKYDSRSNLLFVATRGPAGATVYDATSGAVVRQYEFLPANAAINDVVLTPEGAYFTNSSPAAGAYLYRVGLGTNGQLGSATRIDLPANFAAAGNCSVGPPLSGNGVAVSDDGAYVILVHMSEGKLYRMSVATQQVQPIALSGGDVCSTDGMLMSGSTLYVVQNFLNRVAVVDMAQDHLSGTVTGHITEPFASRVGVKIPTTIADFGDYLYAVTGGFAPPSPDYAVRIEK